MAYSDVAIEYFVPSAGSVELNAETEKSKIEAARNLKGQAVTLG